MKKAPNIIIVVLTVLISNVPLLQLFRMSGERVQQHCSRGNWDRSTAHTTTSVGKAFTEEFLYGMCVFVLIQMPSELFMTVLSQALNYWDLFNMFPYAFFHSTF